MSHLGKFDVHCRYVFKQEKVESVNLKCVAIVHAIVEIISFFLENELHVRIGFYML